MKLLDGINFVTDDKQNKIAVLIDLSIHKEAWEDFYSILIAEAREDEPKRTYKLFRNELVQKGKL